MEYESRKTEGQDRPKSHRKRLKRRLGFSLIEVLVAIGVVATGILALMAVFITGTRSNQHGEELSRATYYARKISEIIRANGLAFTASTIPPPASSGINDAVGTFRPLDQAPSVSPTAFISLRLPKLNNSGLPVISGGLPVLDPADDQYERSIQMRRASNSSTAYNYRLIVMDVTIRWQGGVTGDGRRRVKITSLLKPAGG